MRRMAPTTLVDGGSLAGLTVAANDLDARLGADDSDSVWQGGIDDVRIFSRALTPEEISVLAAK
jgi:hypothetical protein